MSIQNRIRRALPGLALACLHAQAGEYRGDGFRFQYPANWKVVVSQESFVFQADRNGNQYRHVGLAPVNDDNAMIQLWYHQFAPGTLCGSASQHVEGLPNAADPSSFMEQHYVTERFDAGAVVTVKSTRSLKYPGSEVLSSTVCSPAGDTVYVMFGHQAGYPQAARDLVMRTLSLGNGRPTLLGDWNGAGSVLTFNQDGTAQISFSSGMSNRGTYRIADGRIVFLWTVILSSPRTAQWDCPFSVNSQELRLSCEGRTLAYRR